MNTDAARFADLGYLVVPRLFTAEEADQWRRDAMLAQSDHAGDLFSHPKFRELIIDPRIVQVLTTLGITPIRYFGDSSLSYASGSYGFHRDNVDRDEGGAPDWRTPDYPLVRMALYLQDYSAHAGGLEVIPSSHRNFRTASNDPQYLATAVGDLVVWSLRLLHTGFGGVHLPQQSLPRVALFFTYGRPSPLTDRYINYLKTRAYQVQIWCHSAYRHEDIVLAADRGVLVRELGAEIARVPGLGRHVGHVSLSST